MAWVRATATDHMECSQSAYCTQQETLAVTMPRDYMNPGHTLFTKTTVSTIRPVTNGIVPKKKKKKRDDQFKSSEKTAIVYFTGPGMPQRRHFISSAKSSFRAKAKASGSLCGSKRLL